MHFENNVNQNAEIVTEIKNLIVKINNLLSHPDQAAYFVDLMRDELVARYGRERLEEVAGEMLTNPPVDSELSKKFTELWEPLLERFFGGYPYFPYRVEVRYEIGRPNFDKRYDNKMIFAVPASSEPIVVDRILWKMSELREGVRAANADVREDNLRFFAGAPDFEPRMRHFSAEEYLASARQPITEEDWDKVVRENPCPPDVEERQWYRSLRENPTVPTAPNPAHEVEK